jgi:hypothetical protein
MTMSTSAPFQGNAVTRPARAQLVSKRNILFTSITIIVAYVAYGAGVLAIGKLPEAGSFGDSFGAISGLLNGVGLIAAVAAVYLQYNELQATKEEVQSTLELQRTQAQEATRAADAHEKSATATASLAEVEARAAEAHERSVRATHLLAKVQGLSALLAYYGGLRSADLAALDELDRELRGLGPSEHGRRHVISQQMREISKGIDAIKIAAHNYEKDLATVLSESGYDTPWMRRTRQPLRSGSRSRVRVQRHDRKGARSLGRGSRAFG